MNKAVLFGGVAVLILTVVGMKAFKMVDDASITASTDSANVDHTINIGVDNWAGYFILCSPETRKRALDKRVLIRCIDDKANFAVRMENLRTGKLQMAAITVDSYVKNGKKVDYPGSIIFVIDESQGGDAIIVNRSIANNIDDLKNKKGLKIAYTPDSPSQMLVTALIQHFGVPINRIENFTVVPANGSSDALKKLLSGEVHVAVLWEPDVSKALANANYVKLLGTEDTKNLIVDVLVGNHHFVNGNPEVIQILQTAYFTALEYYKTHTDEFAEALMAYSGVQRNQVDKLKDGINWIDLAHNGTDWLGVQHSKGKGRRQLYDTIVNTTRILMASGDLKSNPLPGQDPFRIINSTPFTQIFKAGMAGTLGMPFALPAVIADVSLSRKFKKLSPGRWARLSTIGSLRLVPITFRRGTSELYPLKQDSFTKLVESLQMYPHYRIRIIGHTGRGDKIANANLSKKRSRIVAKYLMDNYGIDKNRISDIGVGNNQPPRRLKMKDGTLEKARAWRARWPRVELVLVEG